MNNKRYNANNKHTEDVVKESEIDLLFELAESINRIPDGKIDDFLEETDRLGEVNNARDQSF